MKGTFQIAKVLGIPVKIHWTFPLVLLLVGWSGYSNDTDLEVTLWLITVIVIIFFCVILHEFGHALAAKFYGIATKDIIILPIAGFARLERLPKNPWQELQVALAGPMVNLFIALLLMPYYYFAPNEYLDSQINFYQLELRKIVPIMIQLNFFLAAFNLIPAFPMDGGQVLRSLLSLMLNRLLATKIAILLGLLFGAGYICYFYFTTNSFLLTLPGIFVFFLAFYEYLSLRDHIRLSKIKMRQIMSKDLMSLEPDDTIRAAVSLSELNKNGDFVVVNAENQPVGLLKKERLQEANAQQNLEAPIMFYMSKLRNCVQANQSVAEIIYHIEDFKDHPVPVLQDGKLVGLVNSKLLWHTIEETLDQKKFSKKD